MQGSMARPSIIIRAWPFFILLLAVFRHSTEYASYALTSDQGQAGQLDNEEAREEAQDVIINYVTSQIDSDSYYGPGHVSATLTDIPGNIRLHTRLFLFNTGSCFGEGTGQIIGYDLVDAFTNNMLSVVRNQIQNSFGFGVVVEGAGDQNLLEEGLSAMFYYWIERIGQPDIGADTPSTDQTKGPSDNNPQRHDELSIISGSSHEIKISIVNKTSNPTTFLNKTQDPKYNAKITTISNVSMGNLGKKDGAMDCIPYNYALFTSLNDINVLTSASSNDGFPNIITSPNKQYYLMMQNDCNLVLYNTQYKGEWLIPTWACGDACYNKGANCFARINLDGTFAVYDGDGNNLWYTPSQCSSGPGCWSDTYLTVQDDGNLVLYLLDTSFAIWATNTYT